jgi:hypothetical protein
MFFRFYDRSRSTEAVHPVGDIDNKVVGHHSAGFAGINVGQQPPKICDWIAWVKLSSADGVSTVKSL